HSAAMREMAVRRVDDGIDRLVEQVAPHRDPGAPQASPGGCFYYFFREDLRLRGTFAPARRASDRPMAIACLRLVTFLPERPLLSVPRLRSCIARSTFCSAFLPYFAMRRPSLPSSTATVQSLCRSRRPEPAVMYPVAWRMASGLLPESRLAWQGEITMAIHSKRPAHDE